MILSREVLELPQGPTAVQWRRSARARRVSLRIDPRSASVVVTLPARVGRSAGLALLIDHAAWVADRLSSLPSVVVFADGAMVPVAGEPHRIRHMPGGTRKLQVSQSKLHVQLTETVLLWRPRTLPCRLAG